MAEDRGDGIVVSHRSRALWPNVGILEDIRAPLGRVRADLFLITTRRATSWHNTATMQVLDEDEAGDQLALDFDHA
ncbi:hypothetical protein ACFYWY_38115 [Streptomyces sp. NPDC002870]|uniref:hypothetical protein n=1 Tax=Streptomyces sp. NPDC002870 TaxID=3364666 RepID=UPI0036B17449